MRQYNLAYKRYIDDKNTISPLNMVRNRFYLIKKYNYVDGDKVNYSEAEAPIIYTIFVSKALDEVHCVKVTNLSPQIVKRFFGKLLNEDTNELEIKGRSKKVYTNVIGTIPNIGRNAYRTYKLSGIKKVLQLDIDVEQITPRKPAIPPKKKIPPKKSK
jgi:hypothetical protein